ncbi:MAG TPA: nickel pincer cofactor biosynthesis protein LarC, partial [Tepidisphaeraceae bacterium]
MIGYLDLPSGISGDMFLGCLIDAGWPIDRLRETIGKLRLPSQDWSVEARSVMKKALRATLLEVKVADQKHHRHLHHIADIINAADLPEIVKKQSLAVFTRLAGAEAKVHGTTLEKIHFHEVGALDAIVDIVGSVAGVHELGIEKLYASALPLGHGWIDSAHGKLPLPAPATLELLAAAGAPSRTAPGLGELVTPTGAALVCELAKFEQPAMTLQRIGIGAGGRECEWPNVARLWLGTGSGQAESSNAIVQIETNIDDMNPQLYAPLSERLFKAGALDVWLAPVQMKKNRPGVLLGVLSPGAKQRELADIILRETTTLGVRVHPVQRFEAERELKTIETSFGPVQVKVKRWGGQS